MSSIHTKQVETDFVVPFCVAALVEYVVEPKIAPLSARPGAPHSSTDGYART
jgi:hypothetical protein